MFRPYLNMVMLGIEVLLVEIAIVGDISRLVLVFLVVSFCHWRCIAQGVAD